jgi:Fe2+ transport system protein FeoA
MKNLNQLRTGQEACIHSINSEDDPSLAIRLAHLGFLENGTITVLKKTPFTGDALLVSIRGTQIALTKKEAAIIEVYLCQKN